MTASTHGLGLVDGLLCNLYRPKHLPFVYCLLPTYPNAVEPTFSKTLTSHEVTVGDTATFVCGFIGLIRGGATWLDNKDVVIKHSELYKLTTKVWIVPVQAHISSDIIHCAVLYILPIR